VREIRSMIFYVVRRLLGVVPVLALVAITSFLLVYLVPGDPAMVMLGSDATPEQLQSLRTQMGLDRSLPEQFVLWGGRPCAETWGSPSSWGGR
jgi:peptide/nickel transport system permease protein